MQSGAKTLSAGGGASLCCLLLLWLIYSHLLREGRDTCFILTSIAGLVSIYLFVFCLHFDLLIICDPKREKERERETL